MVGYGSEVVRESLRNAEQMFGIGRASAASDA
jgi:hypothetical protein